MNDDQFSLASAYLDGELTADERVVAEADPAVMAGVESLRALRDELRDVEPASAPVRESALAAALARFEPSPAPARPDDHGSGRAVAPVVPISKRPWFSPALGVAAVVVVVGLLAVVVRFTGGDDEVLQDAEPMTDELLAEAEDSGGDGADVAIAPSSSAESIETDAAEDGAEDAADLEMAAEAATSQDAAAEATEEAAGGAELGIDAEPCPPGTAADGWEASSGPGSTPQDPITDVDELCDYARGLLASRDAGELASTPETSCPAQVIWGTAYYRAGSEVIESYVAVDFTDRYVTVVDARTCDELIVADLAP